MIFDLEYTAVFTDVLLTDLNKEFIALISMENLSINNFFKYDVIYSLSTQIRYCLHQKFILFESYELYEAMMV